LFFPRGFSFDRIPSITFFLPLKLFEDDVCLWFARIIFLPNLKEGWKRRFHSISFMNRSGLHAIPSFATDNIFLRKVPKCNSGFFQGLNSRKMCLRRHLFACFYRLGLAFMPLRSLSCDFIRRQNANFRMVTHLYFGLITLLHLQLLETGTGHKIEARLSVHAKL